MPRVSDERLAEYAAGGMVPSQDLALDLRDARAECAKWRERADVLLDDSRANEEAANARILALQRTLDRARKSLSLGNVERAKRILDGE